MDHPFAAVPEGKLGETVPNYLTRSCPRLTCVESLNGLQAQFTADSRVEKTDLMCGVYQTETGHPYVLPSVQKVKMVLNRHLPA